MAEVWGAVVGGVIAGGASYASTKEANKKNRRSSWITEGEQFAVNRAREIADRPYQGYSGQRVADLSDNERLASQLALSGQDESRGYIREAGKRVSQLGRFTDADIDEYMNPYTEAVLAPQLREANRAYERERTSLLNSKAGAWGGDRVAFQESELARRHSELISDVTARAHAEAFDRATQLWSQDQDRQLRAAEALRSVGDDLSRLNRQQIQDLMATGQIDRLLRQAQLDFDYQQFIENRDWSISNLDPLLQALGMAQSGERNKQPERDPWSAAIGAASTVAGMYFAGTKDKDEKKPETESKP